MGPPNVEVPAKPRSSTKTSNTFGAPDGALTSNLGGGVAFRISSVFEGLGRGSAIGKTVRSIVPSTSSAQSCEKN